MSLQYHAYPRVPAVRRRAQRSDASRSGSARCRPRPTPCRWDRRAADAADAADAAAGVGWMSPREYCLCLLPTLLSRAMQTWQRWPDRSLIPAVGAAIALAECSASSPHSSPFAQASFACGASVRVAHRPGRSVRDQRARTGRACRGARAAAAARGRRTRRRLHSWRAGMRTDGMRWGCE